MRRRTFFAAAFILAVPMVVISAAREEKIAIDKVPGKVKAAVAKRFPAAELIAAEKEQEDDETIFEIRLKYKEHKFDVSLASDGELREIEKQITVTDLPDAVSRTIADKFAGADVKIVEEVVLVKEGKEALDCYELKLLVDKKLVEAKIAPSGQIKHTEEERDEKEGE